MKNSRFTKRTICEYWSPNRLYFLALVITLVANFFAQTVVVEMFPLLITVFKGLRGFSVLLLFIKVIQERTYLHPNFLWGCIIGGYVLVVAIITDNYLAIIPLFAFIYTSYNIEFEKIIRVSCIVLILCMGVTQLLYGIGIFYSVDAVRGIEVAEGIRKSVGYTFVSFSSNYFFHVALMYVFLRKAALTWMEMIGMLLVNFYFYMQTDTKAVFWLVNVLMITVIVAKYGKLNRTLAVKRVESLALLIGSLGILFITELYRWYPQLLGKLNAILSGRLFEGAKAIDIYGYSLVGQQVEWVFYGDNPLNGESYIYADSSFVNIVVNYGLLTLILWIIGFYLIPYIYKKGDIFYTIAFIFLIVHSIFDPQFMEMYYNPFLLVLGGLFSRRGMRFLWNRS